MLSTYCSKRQSLEEIEFSQLYCNALKIKIIDRIPNAFTFVTKLYLNNNNLLSLTGIHQFNSLQILTFNFNNVTIFSNLQKIKNKFFLKELSYIGNPIEVDLRSQFQYLKSNMFSKLQSFNSIDKVYTSSAKSKKYKKNYDFSEESEDQTERYCQRKFGEYSRKTKRSKKQKTPIRILQNSTMSEKKLQKLINLKLFEGSTTIHQHPSRSLYQDKSFKTNYLSQYDEIYIEPFEEGKQLSPRQQNSDDFLGTARFSQGQSSNLSQSKKEERISLAIQFIDQQKQEIAVAYRERYLKERIFEFLKYETLDEKKAFKSELRRCWVKLKIQAAIQKILQQYRGWV